jgi:hypothetical protein
VAAAMMLWGNAVMTCMYNHLKQQLSKHGSIIKLEQLLGNSTMHRVIINHPVLHHTYTAMAITIIAACMTMA